jgi:serine-type D-Ala-D-Ala carboxypeptidase/endopeptidase (penicillin-binding protein 4)
VGNADCGYNPTQPMLRPPSRKAIFLLALLVAFPLAAADRHKRPDYPPLAARIDTVLAAPELQRITYGIQVVSLKSGKVLYSHNADKLLQPGSDMKLFTTAATLALIGPDERAATTVESTAALDSHGRVAGDVSLVGRGDPNLSGRMLPYNVKTEYLPDSLGPLKELADAVVAAGVKQIDGDIVGDDSYYVKEFPEAWAVDDLQWDYGAPISALCVNDNRIFLDIAPGDKIGDLAHLHVEPESDAIIVENRVTTAEADAPAEVSIHRDPGSNRILLWGSVALGAKPQGEELAVDDPADFAAHLFRALLIQRGVAVHGGTRVKHALPSDAPPPADAKPAATFVLAARHSRPLYDDLQLINKVSHNLHAEMALRLLGKLRGNGGSIDDGLEILKRFMSQAEVLEDEYSFHDGSGLSRETLATASAVVKLLRFAASQPWGKQFAETLPQTGVDGSLRNRFKDSVIADRVRAKTGKYEHIRAFSGYADTLNGDRVAFSVVMNGSPLEKGAPIESMNQIVEQIVVDKEVPQN